MASGDTKTQQYLDIAARGTRADLQRGCCNTRTQDLIMDVAERIITEEETRYREDQILQSEIDEIKNNPDVYDIVATYADLQNYDTSTITDKDVIRVLRDETHDNASTYYRWDAADQEFDYIGETGDYYTKAQVNALLALKADKATTYTKTETDALLDGKQDVLTAGDNVTIEDESGALVISATDTTYSNFTGTDGTTAGAAGLVPAPATTDADKFLKSDGTWAEVSGGGGDSIKTLTSADINWPENNPTGIALWKLDPGIYRIGENGLDIWFCRGSSQSQANQQVDTSWLNYQGLFIVRPGIWNGNPTSSSADVMAFSNNQTNQYAYLQWHIDNNMSDGYLSGAVVKAAIEKEFIPLTGASAPTATTNVTFVGEIYIDTTNQDAYVCVHRQTNANVWKKITA